MTVIERHDELLAQMYLQMHPDLNPDVVRKIVKKISYDNMIDTPCVLHNDITNETIETSLTRTMEWVEQREPIITGNGTFVKQHGELKAPTVKMLESLQRKRDVKKKEMFACDEGSIKYKIKKTAQLNVKKIMNAEYGGSGTPLSPFYSQYIPPATTASAKALTTTLICCLEMASGNTTERMQISISQLYDFIHIILTDEEERIHRVHNAGVSPKQCCDYLIEKVFHPSQQDYDYLLEYLKTLPQDDVCKLYYAFNIKGVLQYEISNKVEYVMEHIKRNLIDIENFNKQDVQNMGYGDGYPQNNGYGSYFNNDDHFYSSNYDLPGNNNQPTFQQSRDSFDWASISNGGSAFNDNNGNNDMFGYNMDAAVKQMNVDDPFAKGVSQFERQRNSTWDTPLDKTNPMMPPNPSCFGCPKVNEATWNNQEALARANEQSSIMDKVNKSFEMNGRLTRDEDWLNVLKK